METEDFPNQVCLNQDLLIQEKEEILTKVAVLLEVDSYETSFLAVEKPEETYLLVATNRTTKPLRKAQEKILELIKKESLNSEDWKYFDRVCKRYMHMNTKQSFCEKVWASAFNKISAEYKDYMFNCKPDVFYCYLKSVIEKNTEVIIEDFKECLVKGIKPQNMSTIVQFLQQLISNFHTVRYYYHWDRLRFQDEVAEFIFRKVHLIDNVKFVEPLDDIPRHAEMRLIDAVVNEESIMNLELFNSKRVCLDCHAFLILFNQASLVPIKFCGAHDLPFTNWNEPHQTRAISQSYEGGKLASDFFYLIRIIQENIPINRKVAEMTAPQRSMFPLPLVIQKALNISENIPF